MTSRADTTTRLEFTDWNVPSHHIDLSPLGVSDRGQVPVMAVTITAPPVLSAPDRRAHTDEALAYMAQQFGFLNATPGCF